MPQRATVTLAHGELSYIVFGRKDARPLIMLPGLGDALATKVSPTAVAFAYRHLAARYRVYLFSRTPHPRPGTTISAMADDLAHAMQTLGLRDSYVLGVSQGGMIAQHLAASYPHLVQKLVLAVTTAHADDVVHHLLNHWISLAEQGRFCDILVDTTEHSYTAAWCNRRRPFYGLFAKLLGTPDARRFVIEARACLAHDARAHLPAIACPTLVLGGGIDAIVGPMAASQLAAQIPQAALHIYPTLGHAAYEEARDFQQRVLAFFAD